MLKNEYFFLHVILKQYYLLAKIGVDTAENEPEVEVWSINYTCTTYVEPRPSLGLRRSPKNNSSAIEPKYARKPKYIAH